MRKTYITLYIILTAWVVAILPTACDTEYEVEHPTADTYISPADQMLIDINKEK